mgnify:FL=1
MAQGEARGRSVCFSWFVALQVANKSSANALWKSLDQLNQSLAQTLLHLGKLYEQDPKNYAETVKYISTLQPLQVSLIFRIPNSYLIFSVASEPMAAEGGASHY